MAQCRLLLAEKTGEVHTVDSFGREADTVVLDLVRDGTRARLETRGATVAMTRAKTRLVLVVSRPSSCARTGRSGSSCQSTSSQA